MQAETKQTHNITEMGIGEILYHIPHRYPFLFIDRLVNIVPMESAIGIKQVTINEPYFQGHFPNKPVMPGVLMIEAIAQTATAFIGRSAQTFNPDKEIVFMRGVDQVKIRQQVVPGDTLLLRVRLLKRRRDLWLLQGEGEVDKRQVISCKFSAVVKPAKESA